MTLEVVSFAWKLAGPGSGMCRPAEVAGRQRPVATTCGVDTVTWTSRVCANVRFTTDLGNLIINYKHGTDLVLGVEVELERYSVNEDSV